MTRDIVVGAVSGYPFESIRYWINSLERSGFRGETVILVGDDDAGLIEMLRARRCTVLTRRALLDESDLLTPGTHSHSSVSVDRHLWMWKYLSSTSADARYVVHADVRDVVFQSDPSAWLERHLAGRRLVVSGEGLGFSDQDWNGRTLKEVCGAGVFNRMRNSMVWNAGVVAGELALMRDLSLSVYLTSGDVLYGDQASLNVLLAGTPYKECTLFDAGEAGWACHAATMAATSRGIALSYKFRGREPLFDGEAVHTSDGEPFCIVHQYDRVPAWKACLERKFG
jgi:hypothetical protein